MVSGRLPRRQVGMARLSVLTAASCVDEKVKYSEMCDESNSTHQGGECRLRS